MPRRPDIDAAVEHVSRYAARPEWAERRRDHMEKMLGRVPESFGLDFEALFNELHQLGHLSSFVGFLDESFLSSEHGAERANVIDDYLRRRGWQESPRAREYLQGMRRTPPSLYETWAVEPGEWIELRDRLEEGPPRRIVEHAGSQTLQRWDCIVARVVHPRDELMLTGGVLSLTRAMADRIEEMFRRVATKGRRTLTKLTKELGLDLALFDDAEEIAAGLADRLFLQAWLKDLLDAARRPLPSLRNTDGDALLFASTRLPVAAGAGPEIGRRLDGLDGWEREFEDEARWVWATGPLDNRPTILGNARIEGDLLVVETNSRERMERALAALRGALGELVGEGLTSYEDPVQALRNRPPGATSAHAEIPENLSAEDAAAMADAMKRFMDDHYRRTLDEPLPMLGNRTPRQCARSKRGRAELVRWLKELENNEQRRAARAETTPYDFAWMWRELGVEGER